MKMRSFQFRQVRTMLILALLVCACVAGGLYIRNRPVAQEPVSAAAYTDADVAEAVARYRKGDSQAVLATESAAEEPLKATLLFYGTCDVKTAGLLAETLAAGKVTAQFFFAPEELGRSGEMIARLYEAGYPVGVLASDTGKAAAGEELAGELCRAGLTMQGSVGMHPATGLSLTQPGETLLTAAAAAYLTTVYCPSEEILPETITSAEDAQTRVDDLHRGSLVSIPLKGVTEEGAAGLTWLIGALSQTDLRGRAKELLAAADPAEAAAPVTMIYTTERAVAFTFSGLGSDAELDGVLKALSAANATATFFVTEREASQYVSQLRQIVNAGHRLGAAAAVGGTMSDADVLEGILRIRESLRTSLGYTGELPVRSAVGTSSESLERAAAAGGFALLSSSVTMTLPEDAHATDAAEVLERIRPEARGAFRRGEVVHFQLGMYQSSDTLLGELIRLCAKERNIYTISAVLDILRNEEYTYVYPVPEDQILPEVKDKVHPGQLTGVAFTQLALRYVGIRWVNDEKTLPGFTKDEIKQLDQTGLVVNDGNMVFLTFDDWGTDATITALLDVLRGHKAKATFFIRTNHIASNPNLVRAIAAEGHAIGSHTDTHFPLSNVSADGKYYTSLTAEQATALSQDLTNSYQALQRIIGDMAVDGRPSLCRIFRPPTLAVSRLGLETVLDCGFSYVVSGSCTTQDYKATSRESLLKLLTQNTKSGAVFVMHMSDGSIYTASALQSYFDYWEKNPPKTGAYQFCSLPEVLKD